ncbi:2-succinyl-6-hydroxy-2,4-cyclohexadiene-1-carboxy late synthase [Virgibacillus siamensis]|uniref:Putative 2-succinyl-6-hydroxy-2,4-cyclohexadiene-1-carboxylate synthase n=1 Tax=Virgibacillus siamensis TaxID=480071 RepID=A0ABN1FD30_9BACI
MLHGFTGSSETWSGFVRQWQHEFQVITIDLPGHGKTRHSRPVTMEECCSDLVSLFNHLALRKVHVIGYSMGGRTALSLAMLYPEKLCSLTLESTSPGLSYEQERMDRRNRDTQLAKRLERDGIEVFVHFWENIPLFDTQKKLLNDTRQKIRNERLNQSAEGLAMSLRSMGTGQQPSWWGRLHELKLPVLLLAGAYDEKFIGINKKMAKRMQQASLRLIENAGHAIHVEQPQIFGKIVTEFLRTK